MGFALSVVALLGVALFTGPAPVGGAPDGKAIFLAQKCNLCHSIDAAGIPRTSKAEKTKGPDLAGVAKKHDAAWIKAFITKQKDLNGKKHLKEFKGSAADLDALVSWLGKQ
jgi:mono/diheme cytochrome c family protein